MSASDLVGHRVRHLRITGLLGAGGMGAVYEAFDENLHRKVALKAIRPEDRLEPEARARFLREARILSRLDDPRICQIHEYLEEDDGDYLVLELIEGRTLRRALRRGLDRATGLEIAQNLAEALITAHEQRIVHRDLKPGNVMVTDDGLVKVLDFGLSRASDARLERILAVSRKSTTTEALASSDALEAAATVALSEGSAQTSTERVADSDIDFDSDLTARGSLMGTLEYMSPEQAMGEAVTPASDVYALGLVFQELLTGTPPHPPNTPAAELVARTMRAEVQPFEGLPDDLARLLHRMQSGAPGARPSIRDVAERLAWIRDAPRRRRRKTALVGTVVASALAAVVFAVQAVRISDQARQLEREAAASKQIADFLIDLFEVSDPGESRGNEVTAREILDRGATRIELDLGADAATRARLMTTMGRVYTSLGLYEPAERLLEEGLTVRQAALKPGSAELAESLLQLGSLRRLQERFDDAERLLDQALEITAAAPDEKPDVAIEALNARALLDFDRAEYDRAEELYRSALQNVELADLETDRADELRGDLLNNLAGVHFRRHELDRSIALVREALEIQTRRWGREHPETTKSANNLAGMLHTRGDFEEAERLYKETWEIRNRILGPNHPETALSLNNLGYHYSQRGIHDQAEDYYQRAIAAWKEALGPRHGQVATGLNNLATLFLDQGRLDEAEALYRESLSIREETKGPEHPEVGLGYHNLGNFLVDRGHYEEAENMLLKAIEIWSASIGPEHPNVAASCSVLGSVYLYTGRLDEAERFQRRGLAIREAQLGGDHPSTATSFHNLAGVLADLGRGEEASAAQRRALEIWDRTLDPGHPNIGRALSRLSAMERQLGHLDEAEDLLERGATLAEQAITENPAQPVARIRRSLVLLEQAQLALEREEPETARDRWEAVASDMVPLARNEDSMSARELAVLALLYLERTDEARPMVAQLVATGLKDQEILELARAQGLPVEE